jgi:hypothetical protein
VRRPRRWPFAVAAVAVVAIVVVSLFAFGVLRLGPSNSAVVQYETFSQAESTAVAGAGSVAGGPWFAVAGAAIATPVEVAEPATNLSSLLDLANCTFVWPHGPPANVVIAATPLSSAAGTAGYWAFLLKNVSNTLLLESVSDGSASAVLLASGSQCVDVADLLVSFPVGVVNSPQVIAAVNGVGGSAFLSEYPNATRFWGAIGGISVGILSSSPMWFVEYTSCSVPTSSSTSGAVFNATVGGTSGVVTNHSAGRADCALTAPTGFSLALPAGGDAPAARKAI